eukprot:363350-Chlamydomonas_euryale.AAC.3
MALFARIVIGNRRCARHCVQHQQGHCCGTRLLFAWHGSYIVHLKTSMHVAVGVLRIKSGRRTCGCFVDAHQGSVMHLLHVGRACKQPYAAAQRFGMNKSRACRGPARAGHVEDKQEQGMSGTSKGRACCGRTRAGHVEDELSMASTVQSVTAICTYPTDTFHLNMEFKHFFKSPTSRGECLGGT